MTLRELIHPREAILETMDRIYRYRMTTTSGGNISIRDDSGDIWISPARVDKGSLQARDIVQMKSDGELVGLHPPSSELPFHQAIYEARPDVNAIVHGHPPALVAFSITRSTPNTAIFQQAHGICGKVGFAEYACPGTASLGESIAKQFRAGCDSVVLENHGVVVAADNITDAFARFEAFEFAGKTLIKAFQLAKPSYLSEEQLQEANSDLVDFGEFEPSEASSRERELRQQISEFVRRGCRQRLLISTEGSFSARLNDNEMLITPSKRDRGTLRSEDIVLMKGNAQETGKRASRAARLHQAIYQRHPEVSSIVFAHPVNATAFSITDVDFDVRTIPESYVFLRDVPRVPYDEQYSPDGKVAEHVSPNRPVALLQNNGALVVGQSVLDAFDRLEVLDATAEALIDARSIGKVSPMPDSVIEELRSVFKLV